jgi:outer membrane protein OmpA-like peptidoglycan-associated protein
MYRQRKREQRTDAEAKTTRRPASVGVHAQASGTPLDHGTREFMERRFGHDFGRVRVHTDSAAASSAKLAGAQAYTVGNNVVFGSGLYNPGSPSGRQLLAHELAHVVQQNKSVGATAQAPDYESEASRASHQIAQGERASVALAAPTAVQRQAIPGTLPPTDLAESASPLRAAAIGSVTLDGFDVGKADISADNRAKLAETAKTMLTLFKKYSASTVRVIGYTDAVGQESDSQALGQARADSVQAALLKMGIPGSAIVTESRGASEPVENSKKSEPRNRRVRVRFEPAQMMHTPVFQGLTLSPGLGQPTPPPTPPPTASGVKVRPSIDDLCIITPSLCQVSPGGPPKVPEAALKPIPDDTPYERMDVQAVAEAYTSHGSRPEDLRATWAKLYWKYRKLGLKEEDAATMANRELSSTAGSVLGRDNPNAADRLDRDMQNAYPDAKTLGPASVTLFEF